MGADIDEKTIFIKKLKFNLWRCLQKSGFASRETGNQTKFIQIRV